jgi:hypothetical protein
MRSFSGAGERPNISSFVSKPGKLGCAEYWLVIRHVHPDLDSTISPISTFQRGGLLALEPRLVLVH